MSIYIASPKPYAEVLNHLAKLLDAEVYEKAAHHALLLGKRLVGQLEIYPDGATLPDGVTLFQVLLELIPSAVQVIPGSELELQTRWFERLKQTGEYTLALVVGDDLNELYDPRQDRWPD
ncbi:MAG: hypothetical protein ACOYL5_09010 [Phototrophicaceae bacterium]|jgi:hypothetical protein